MKDVHDSSTFDWVETIGDNTHSNKDKQSETEQEAPAVKTNNHCVSHLRTTGARL
jgi:hypothetical protein